MSFSYVKSLFGDGDSVQSPSKQLHAKKTTSTSENIENKIKEANGMINKMDFTAYQFEQADPIKYNREKVRSQYQSKHSIPPIFSKNQSEPSANQNQLQSQNDKIEHGKENKTCDKITKQNSKPSKVSKPCPKEDNQKSPTNSGELRMPRLEDFGLDPNVDYDKLLGLKPTDRIHKISLGS